MRHSFETKEDKKMDHMNLVTLTSHHAIVEV